MQLFRKLKWELKFKNKPNILLASLMTGGKFFHLVTLLPGPIVNQGPPWHKNLSNIRTPIGRTFPSHAHFETLLESTILTLVSVVLVNGTTPVAPAGVGQVSSHGSLEEGLAPLAGKLSVVLSTGLVPTHNTLNLRPCLVGTVSGAIGAGYRGGARSGRCRWGVLDHVCVGLWNRCHRLGSHWGRWGRGLLGCCLRSLRHGGRRRWRSRSRSCGHCPVELILRRAPLLQAVVRWSPGLLQSLLGRGTPGCRLANRCVHHSHISSQHCILSTRILLFSGVDSSFTKLQKLKKGFFLSWVTVFFSN